MKNQELIDYINSQIDKGVPIEKIKQILLNNGWKEEDVNNAINSTIQENPSKSNAKKIEDGAVDPRFLIAWIIYCVVTILLETVVLFAPELFPLVLSCCGNILIGWTVFNVIIFFIFLSKKKDKGVLQLIGFYLVGYTILSIAQVIQLVMKAMEDPDFNPFEPNPTGQVEISIPWALNIIFHIILLIMSIRLYKKQKK